MRAMSAGQQVERVTRQYEPETTQSFVMAAIATILCLQRIKDHKIYPSIRKRFSFSDSSGLVVIGDGADDAARVIDNAILKLVEKRNIDYLNQNLMTPLKKKGVYDYIIGLKQEIPEWVTDKHYSLLEAQKIDKQ